MQRLPHARGGTAQRKIFHLFIVCMFVATVLFTVCSAVTVECCVLYPCCVGVFGMFAVI